MNTNIDISTTTKLIYQPYQKLNKEYRPYTKTIFDINFPTSVWKEKNATKVDTEGTDQESQIIRKKLLEMAKVIQTIRNILNSIWQKYQLHQISTSPKFTLPSKSKLFGDIINSLKK